MTTSETIQLTIESKEALKEAYLPFLTKGGLVVPVAANHELGDEIEVTLKLLKEDPIKFTGKVAWMTPPGSHIAHHNGIGVELSSESAREVRKKVEVLLAGTSKPA